jgi:sporulation protein YlmC with PRC-barrel domain
MRLGRKPSMIKMGYSRYSDLKQEGKMEIAISARVQCTDGIAGEATHVILHPETKRITRMVVKDARAPHVQRLVPFKLVEDATSDQIFLRCTVQDLSRMQPFIRTEFVEKGAAYYGGTRPDVRQTYVNPQIKKVKRENISPDELAMVAGTRVKAADGNAGRLDEFVVEPESGSITHLMLREGHVWAPKEVTIPISEVDRIAEKIVYLRMKRANVAALPAIPVRRG